MSTRNNNGARPLALRAIAGIQAAAFIQLQGKDIALNIGPERWLLRFSAQPGPSAGPSVCARGTWLGHRIALRFPQALLQRTLQLSAPGHPPVDIPGDLLTAVACNALGVWLDTLAHQDSLRIDTVEEENPAHSPLTSGNLQLYLLANRIAPAADAIKYTIALDLDQALTAALPQLCEGLPPRLPQPQSALSKLNLTLKLQCEIGRAHVPYQTLDLLQCGDILFFTPYTDPVGDDPAALIVQLSYRTRALMRAHILQPGLMAITHTDMNDKKSFLYDDLINEPASDPLHGVDAMHFLNEETEEEEMEYGAPADPFHAFERSKNLPQDHAERLNQLPLQVVFDVGNCEMSFAELQKLQPGSLIPLASSLPEIVRVTVNGRLIASGELVEIDGKIGIMLAHLADA